MGIYFAPRAMLPQGWCEQVRIEVNEAGVFTKIEANASAEGAEILCGPVIAGMPNLHSHAFQYAMAGLAEVVNNVQDNFWSWRELMYRMVVRLQPEEIQTIASSLYIDMLKAGYTQVAEFHYLHHDVNGKAYGNPAELSNRILAAANDSGIGLTLLPVLYSHSGFGGQTPSEGQRRFINSEDAYLDLFEQLSAQVKGDLKQNLGLCFHSLRAVTPEQIDRVLSATRQSCPIHIHIAEQQKEVKDCLAWSGQRPVEWLFNHVNVNKDWCLVHATHVNEAELAKMAASQAVAGLCLTTEANLGDGIFPGSSYLAQGGRFGIGSDSHVSVSLVEELRWFEYGQRLRDERRNCLVGEGELNIGQHLFQQALRGGAQACGQKIGQIEEGYRADFVVLDQQQPFIATAKNDEVLNRWLFAAGDKAVRDVYVAGEQRIDQGHHGEEERIAKDMIEVLKTLLD